MHPVSISASSVCHTLCFIYNQKTQEPDKIQNYEQNYEPMNVGDLTVVTKKSTVLLLFTAFQFYCVIACVLLLVCVPAA